MTAHALAFGRIRRIVMLMVAGVGLGAALDQGVPPAMAQDAHSVAALGWLSVEPSPSGVLVVGHVLGLSEGDVDTAMTVSRSGKAGTAQTSQSNRVSLKPGEAEALSRTALSFAPGDRLSIELKLSHKGRTISISRIETGG